MVVKNNMLYKLKPCALKKNRIKKPYTKKLFWNVFARRGHKSSGYVPEKTWQIHRCPVWTEMTDSFELLLLSCSEKKSRASIYNLGNNDDGKS